MNDELGAETRREGCSVDFRVFFALWTDRPIAVGRDHLVKDRLYGFSRLNRRFRPEARNGSRGGDRIIPRGDRLFR